MRENKLVAYLLVLIFLAGLISGCARLRNLSKRQGDQEEAAQGHKVPVEIAPVQTGSIENTREFSGSLKPIKDIMIIPQIPGKVSKIHVEVGQEVKEGDIIMELEASDIDQQIAQAQAAYEASKASVDLSKERLNELESQKDKLEDGLKQIDRQIGNINKTMGDLTQVLNSGSFEPQQLIEMGVITQEKYLELQQLLEKGHIKQEELKATLKEELEKRLGDLQGSLDELVDQKSKLEESKVNIETAIKSMPYDSKTLDAQLKQAKTAMDAAQKAKDKLKLYSPIDGIVGSLNVDEGEVVTQSLPPANIIDMNALLLDIRVSEFDVNRIQPGQKLNVYVEAVGPNPIQGEVDWVSPSPDARVQAYLVRIKLDNSSDRLRPGMFARAKLVLDKKENTLTILKRAVIREQDSFYVFVVNGDSVEKREITVGLDDGNKIEVISGLEKGERVVVKGQAYLEDGQEIYIVQEETI